jgi:flagellar biosynthesis protein FlhB
MTENGRFIPPHPGREAAAAQKGLFPRSRMLVVGFSLLATSAALFGFQSRVGQGFVSLFEKGLAEAIHRHLPLGNALSCAASEVLLPFLCLCLAPFIGATLGAWVPVLIFRKTRGSTAVPLPKIDGGKWETAIFRLFGALVFCLVALYIVRDFRLVRISPGGVISAVGILLLRLLTALGGILTLVGIGELLIMRVAIFHGLFLNRSEARQEHRALRGSPEMVRRERRRIRSEDRR